MHILSLIFSPLPTGTSEGTSGMSMSAYGFFAMMTHLLSFPIQARGVVQRNLEEVPRSILPVRLLSCHYRMDLLPLGISGTLGSDSDTLGSDSGTFISVHVLTASCLISPSRFMFSVLCLTTYVLCFTASLGTSGTFTSELRSVLVYIARLVLVNYSVRKLTLYAPQPRLPSDSSASATFTSLTSVLLDLRSPRPPYPSTSVSVLPENSAARHPAPLWCS